ncbi:MAG: hypothetical protein ACI83P_000198 [Janthinobacterium sp.]|jgi:hypothetical protein
MLFSESLAGIAFNGMVQQDFRYFLSSPHHYCHAERIRHQVLLRQFELIMRMPA